LVRIVHRSWVLGDLNSRFLGASYLLHSNIPQVCKFQSMSNQCLYLCTSISLWESKLCTEIRYICPRDARGGKIGRLPRKIAFPRSLQLCLRLVLLHHGICNNTALDFPSCRFGHVVREVNLQEVRTPAQLYRAENVPSSGP
jgi:hypothetical protein